MKFLSTRSQQSPVNLSQAVLRGLANDGGLFVPEQVAIAFESAAGTLPVMRGGAPVPFLDKPANWVWTYIFLGVWQSVGWNTIIYLAALTNINQELYEAASVDGAGRFRKIWHITLPGLRPTIVTLLIMSLGRILGSEFDRPYALTNKLVTSVSHVISVFVYINGIKSSQFSLSAAVGLFQSAVCVIFLLSANSLAKRFGERGVW